jgi:EKC/KEOPS complex subunit CGI121/TPRKB
VLFWIRFWQTSQTHHIIFRGDHSNNGQIAESFRRFGITDETASLIAVKIIPANGTEDDQIASVSAVSDHLKASIEGDPLPLTESNLAALSDVPKICKIYKVEDKKATPNVFDTSAGRMGQVEGTILGIMATKGS